MRAPYEAANLTDAQLATELRALDRRVRAYLAGRRLAREATALPVIPADPKSPAGATTSEPVDGRPAKLAAD